MSRPCLVVLFCAMDRNSFNSNLFFPASFSIDLMSASVGVCPVGCIHNPFILNHPHTYRRLSEQWRALISSAFHLCLCQTEGTPLWIPRSALVRRVAVKDIFKDERIFQIMKDIIYMQVSLMDRWSVSLKGPGCRIHMSSRRQYNTRVYYIIMQCLWDFLCRSGPSLWPQTDSWSYRHRNLDDRVSVWPQRTWSVCLVLVLWISVEGIPFHQNRWGCSVSVKCPCPPAQWLKNVKVNEVNGRTLTLVDECSSLSRTFL